MGLQTPYHFFDIVIAIFIIRSSINITISKIIATTFIIASITATTISCFEGGTHLFVVIGFQLSTLWVTAWGVALADEVLGLTSQG